MPEQPADQACPEPPVTIDQGQWRWCGSAHHNAIGFDCRFALATQVGEWVVSTVGDWRPVRDEAPRPVGPEPDALYETCVFPAGEPGECGVARTGSAVEVAGRRWTTRAQAVEGHAELCRRAAAGAYPRDADHLAASTSAEGP